MPGRIEDYALIGDLQTAALVGRDGSVDWLCLPRFDSAACFAALLHDPSAGRWLLAPVDGGPATRRRYRGDSLVLESEWDTAGGSVRVVDFMPPTTGPPMSCGSWSACPVAMRMDLLLRFDYGSVAPWVRTDGPDLGAVAGPDAVWLRAGAPLATEADRCTAAFRVRAGERVPFVLTYRASHLPVPSPVLADEALAATATGSPGAGTGGGGTARSAAR
ncbi:MAG TPA: trehalase-like domain-containing protein [Pilimelia sp.]|nr:trehalase-like domain-containing protein [Pilimelia sp.]